jgi:hypothetical protein
MINLLVTSDKNYKNIETGQKDLDFMTEACQNAYALTFFDNISRLKKIEEIISKSIKSKQDYYNKTKLGQLKKCFFYLFDRQYRETRETPTLHKAKLLEKSLHKTVESQEKIQEKVTTLFSDLKSLPDFKSSLIEKRFLDDFDELKYSTHFYTEWKNFQEENAEKKVPLKTIKTKDRSYKFVSFNGFSYVRIAVIGLGGAKKATLLFNPSNGKTLVHLTNKKVLDNQESIKEDNQMFLRREIEIAESLKNTPNIAKIKAKLFYQSKKGKTKYSFLAPYYNQGSLSDVISTNPLLNKEKILDYMKQMANGVEKIHLRGWIHQDIKLQNFLVKKEKIYLSDLETVIRIKQIWLRILQLGNKNGDYALHGRGCGTPGFCDPRIVLSENRQKMNRELANKKSDIFSLGVCLYLLKNPTFKIEDAGAKPQRSLTIQQTIQNKLKDSSDALDKLILEMTDADQKTRPTIQEVLNRLNMMEVGENQEYRLKSPLLK